MVKKIKEALLYPIVVLIASWMFFRTKSYYISGTGISNLTGERMWFKTALTTQGRIFPLKDIEDAMKKELNFKTCIVVYFHRIPRYMIKYMSESFQEELTIIKTEVHENH